MQLVIDTSRTSLSVKNKSFYVKNLSFERMISPKRVSSIAITTNCQINAAAIRLAAECQVPIYFFNMLGEIEARLWSPYFSNTAELRKQQLRFYDTSAATQWVIGLIKRKSTIQIQTLRQLSKNRTGLKPQLELDVLVIAELINKLETFSNFSVDECRNSILGLEGNISKIYFKNLSALLPEPFQFEKRSRRPAMDYFNAALNYLYGMTYSVVESGVFAKGFDPFAGYLHTDNYLKNSLVFDLIEPIRPFIDRLMVELCNSGLLVESHFENKQQGYWLNKSGKHIIIPAFNDFLFRRVRAGEKVMRIKDMIFNESFELGRVIANHFKDTAS